MKLTCFSYELFIKDSLNVSTRCILEVGKELDVTTEAAAEEDPLVWRWWLIEEWPEKDAPKDVFPLSLSDGVDEYPMVLSPTIIVIFTFSNFFLLIDRYYMKSVRIMYYSINSNSSAENQNALCQYDYTVAQT